MLLGVADRFYFYKYRNSGKEMAKDENENKRDEEEKFLPPSGVIPTTIVGRLWYGIKLSQNMRGGGWSFQIENLPPIPLDQQRSRPRFLLSQFKQLFLSYLLLDLSSTYQRRQPYFLLHPYPHSLSSLPLSKQIPFILSSALIAYSILSLLYAGTCIICAGTLLWSVEECPPLFGGGTRGKTFGVGVFWGNVWHQAFRRVFTSPTKYWSRSSTISSRTRKIVILITAFSLSGLQHSLPLLVATKGKIGLGAFIFFAIQPIAIVVEALALSNSTVLKPTLAVLWLMWSSRWFVDDLVYAEFWKLNSAPFSFFKGVLWGEWWDSS